MPNNHKSYIGINLTEKKYGRLTPMYIKEGTLTKWICKCDCGNIKEVYAGDLERGKTKSCGCLEKENLKIISKSNLKHGMTDTILYEKWCGIKNRCYNPKYKYYHRYGGRGIKMCEEWQGEHGFENFVKWAYEAGYDDNKHDFQQTIDRIDTDKDYCPSNCKWSTQLEQVRNRSNAKLIEDVDGEKITSDEFSRKHNIDKESYVYRRLKKGKTAKEILNEWDRYIQFSNGDYMSKKEASIYYNVCVATISNWINNKLIEAVYIRNQYYIPKGQPRPVFK